jgi:acylglycerol lipase
VRKVYVEDPLNFVGNVRVRTARQVERGMNRLKPHYKKITIPVYGLHGESDRCTSLRGHKNFINSVSSTDKTLDVVVGGYHELLMGPQKDECIQKLASWILSRISGPQIKTPL